MGGRGEEHSEKVVAYDARYTCFMQSSFFSSKITNHTFQCVKMFGGGGGGAQPSGQDVEGSGGGSFPCAPLDETMKP